MPFKFRCSVIALMLAITADGFPARAQNLPQNAPAASGSPTGDSPASGSGPFLYATSEDNTLNVVSTKTNAVVAVIPVGLNPWSVAVGPSRVYVANHGDGNTGGSHGTSTVSVIDAATNKVIDTISLNNPRAAAMALAISPTDGSRVYVSMASMDDASRCIEVIDTKAGKVVAAIPFPLSSDEHNNLFPQTLTVSPSGDEVYVGTAGVDVVVIRTSDNTVSGFITLTDLEYNRHIPKGGMARSTFDIQGISFAPDGRKAYVVSGFGASFAAIDTATRAVTFPATFGRSYISLSAVAISPDGSRIYTTAIDKGTAYGIDMATDAMIKTGGITPDGKSLFVGASPSAVVFAPDGKKAYISNRDSHSLSVIDVASNTPVAIIPLAGRYPRALAIQPAPAQPAAAPDAIVRVSLRDGTVVEGLYLDSTRQAIRVKVNEQVQEIRLANVAGLEFRDGR